MRLANGLIRINNKKIEGFVNLFRFDQFLLEAAKTEHSDLRIDQRIVKTLSIDLDPRASSEIKKTGANVGLLSAEIKEEINKEFSRRLKSLESAQITDGYVTFVFLEPLLKIGNLVTPITMAVSSWDEDKPHIIKTYTGEKICFYLFNNELKTLKVQPSKWGADELARNAEAHFRRKHNRDITAKVIYLENAKFVISINSDGTINRGLQRTAGKILTGEREYALSSGRFIKTYIKFLGGMAPVEVEDVMNRETARADGFIKLAIILPDGRKMQKVLNPGDPIEVPIDDTWHSFKVADSLFVDYANRGGAFSVKITN